MATPALDATNVVLLDGVVAGEPRRRQLPSGDTVMELDVTTRGAAGTCSVPVAWFDPPAASAAIEAGREVVVVGFARRRFFRAGGATQSRTEVVAARIVRRDRSRDVVRLRAGLVALLGAGGDAQRT